MSLTSGLHGPRVLLTIPNTFDDFVVISVICFPQDSIGPRTEPCGTPAAYDLIEKM